MVQRRRRRRSTGFASAIVVATILLVVCGEARADLQKGVDGLIHGDYALARRALLHTTGPNAPRAKLALASLEQEVGNYEKAETLSRSLLTDSIVGLDAHIALAAILRETGRYGQATGLLKAQLGLHPSHLATRHALGLAYEAQGQSKRARALWNLFFDDFSNGKIDLNSAKAQYFVGEAARYLGSVEDASSSYENAIAIDANFHRANLDWGRLFLSKYNDQEAQQSFSDILKINSKHANALAAMAALKVKNGYDANSAQEFIAQALATNPRNVRALLVRASIETDRGEWGRARTTCAEALAVNPESLQAHAQLAAISWLHEDMSAYVGEKQHVLGINPRFSEFFHIVMRSAEREHRYERALKLGEEAVRINPLDYEAMQLQGSAYLRLGLEKKGLQWLRRARAGDQFNARTLNLLDLFETYIPRQYVMTQSKNFRIRYHKDERRVLERYVTPLMEEAFVKMVKRYGFTPSKPITLELYKNPEHYAVRTIGLPGLGALGVCFGHVVTALSPSVGDLNWGMVMWHELSHIFAIQMSDYKVPRWFTEGLSEYETIRARPEWRRENDSDLWAALQDNTLPSVAQLDLAFMDPRMDAVVVAYHLSSVTIEYIVAEFGFDVIVEALKLFAKGAGTSEVIEKISGKSIREFDEAFRAHLRRRLAPYRGSLELPLKDMDDLAALSKAASEHPKSASMSARLALGQFYAGKAEQASLAAKTSLALDPKNHIGLYISAEMALQKHLPKKAREFFSALVRVGGDSFDVRVRLAMLAQKRGDRKSVIGHLQSAKRLDPERSYPYQALAQFFEKEGKTALAMKELETYVMIEQMKLAPLLTLMKYHAKAKSWSRVIHFGTLALMLDPARGEVQLTLAKAYQETQRYDEALYALDTALLIRPRLRRPALAHLGRARAYLAKGDRRSAQRAILDVLDLEPENAEGLKLSASLESTR